MAGEMSPWVLLVLCFALMLGPWVLMPRRQDDGEIRGLRRLLWRINAALCAYWYGLEAQEMAPLPDRGPAILIANHTSPIDPMLLQATSRRVLGFLIAKEYFDYWLYRPMCRLLRCIPVRRDGHDLAATRAALRALDEGRVVPIFPEGQILPCSGRELGQPKPGVAFLVLHARVPVIPAYIWGTPETGDFGTALRTPARARVIYGRPIDVAKFAPAGPINKAALTEVSEQLMEEIRALRARVLPGAAAGEPKHRMATAHGSNGMRRPDEVAGTVPGDGPAVPRS
jgi:1-acyl-sn-glycerol-3-phosphate acyltransferase